MDALPGWRPDPFGLHEFRFFALGGTPTRLVSDDNFRSVFASNERLHALPGAPTNGSIAAERAERPELAERSEPEAGAGGRGVVMAPPRRADADEGAAAPPERARAAVPAAPPPPATLFCAQCGSSHKETAAFCPGCGQRVSEPG